MSEEDIKKGTYGQIGRTGGVALFALAGGLLFWMIFKEEISSFFEFTKTVEKHQEDIAELKLSEHERDQFIDATEKDLIDLKDFQGDITDELARRRIEIDENTEWRIGQEKRATSRIKDQKFREKRLVYVEEFIEKYRFSIEKNSKQCFPK